MVSAPRSNLRWKGGTAAGSCQGSRVEGQQQKGVPLQPRPCLSTRPREQSARDALYDLSALSKGDDSTRQLKSLTTPDSQPGETQRLADPEKGALDASVSGDQALLPEHEESSTENSTGRRTHQQPAISHPTEWHCLQHGGLNLPPGLFRKDPCEAEDNLGTQLCAFVFEMPCCAIYFLGLK
ncbi:hypothetical protein P7K49_029982 [Saguinus oedipus]|uniref:Uncharacterized protein n=1 Tax=Saguinus oedipus TaxID=9490 RepID=A0ABQ9U8S5_SAGOE|nr:hypothetical protein P7K49_029982 [Saguinus oedipus]